MMLVKMAIRLTASLPKTDQAAKERAIAANCGAS